DPQMGTLRFPGVSVKFDGVRPDVRMPPRLGEHTRQALLAAGLPAVQVEALIAAGAARAAKETS
ncbi:MAG: CoA transferase, partial [Variovorax sp.]|nr:CoA transferase [Variovorax sp.]